MVSATFVVLAGIVKAVLPWDSFARFHAENMIPWVVGLEITRAWGAWGAAIVACLHVTAFHHGTEAALAAADTHAGPDQARPRGARLRSAVVAACSVPALYLPVSLLALGSALTTARIAFGVGPGLLRLLEVQDVGVGYVTAGILGIVPFAWTFAGTRLFSSKQRGLGSKLFITWLCMLGVSVVFSIVSWAVQPSRPGFPSSG